MLAFYHPDTQERVNESVLYALHGYTPENYRDGGWYMLDITPPAYDRRFYTPVETGVEHDETLDIYRLTWDLRPLPVDTVKTTLKNELAAIRYDHETDGVVVNGQTILTDRESQSAVASAKLYSDANPDKAISWKAASGWVVLDNATITAMAKAVGDYVQACFDREKELNELIDAATDVDELVEVAAQFNEGWPPSAGVNAAKSPSPMSPFPR